jgi:hypothetical protein
LWRGGRAPQARSPCTSSGWRATEGRGRCLPCIDWATVNRGMPWGFHRRVKGMQACKLL